VSDSDSLSFRDRRLVFEHRFSGELLLQSVPQLQQSFFFLTITQHTAMTISQQSASNHDRTWHRVYDTVMHLPAMFSM